MNRDLTQSISYSNATFMSQVYFWMMVGLILSGGVAFYLANNQALIVNIFSHSYIWFGLIILQFVAVISLTALLDKMNVFVTTLMYLFYSALSGVTLSVMLLIFTAASVYQAFFITAFAFAGLSLIGFITKRDLGPVGSFCTIGLFGLIGFMLITMLFPSIATTSVQMAINTMGIMIFAGLTAYDTQRIKNFNTSNLGMADVKKQAVHGALLLYLDFINLFINILNLFGERR